MPKKVKKKKVEKIKKKKVVPKVLEKESKIREEDITTDKDDVISASKVGVSILANDGTPLSELKEFAEKVEETEETNEEEYPPLKDEEEDATKLLKDIKNMLVELHSVFSRIECQKCQRFGSCSNAEKCGSFEGVEEEGEEAEE